MNTMNGCSGSCSPGGSMGNYRGNMNMNQRTNRCRQGSCGMSDAEMKRIHMQCQDDPANRCNDDPLYGMPLAIGYVPWQQWGKIYDPCEGLANGTIFPELNLPFLGCIPRGAACGKGGRV